MALPKAKTKYHISSSCPDCGCEHVIAWETVPVEGTPDLLTRQCFCPECGCRFNEGIRLDLRSVDIERMRTDGEEERRTDRRHHDTCPFCGKPLEEDDPYFGDEEEVDYLRTRDAEDWTYRRSYYCLDCHADLKEDYKMERVGVEVFRRGMGSKGSESCPECDSMNVNYSVKKVADTTYMLRCECRECGCEYEVASEESYGHTRVIADRDGWYADDDYEDLFFDRIAKVGDTCPMCDKGVVAASPGFESPDENPRRGLRGSRVVSCECLKCFTQFDDHYDTRIVSKRIARR